MQLKGTIIGKEYLTAYYVKINQSDSLNIVKVYSDNPHLEPYDVVDLNFEVKDINLPEKKQ